VHLKYKIVKIDGARMRVDLLLADKSKDPRMPLIRVGQLDVKVSDWAAFRSNLPDKSIVED